MTHSSFRSCQASALESNRHFYQGSIVKDWDLLECKQMNSILFSHQETTPACEENKTSHASGFPHKLLTALHKTQLQFLIHRFFPSLTTFGTFANHGNPMKSCTLHLVHSSRKSLQQCETTDILRPSLSQL